MRPKSHERALCTAEAHRAPARPDLAVARIAAGCEGVVDLDELRACGLSRNAISSRVKAGRLFPIHSRIYAVGHPVLSLTARFVAAVKACGPGAGLTHRASAAYWGIRDWTEADIEVTVPGELRRRHPGIRAHRSSLVRRSDFMVRSGVLVATPTWTVFTLGSVLGAGEVTAAARRALGLGLTSVPQLVALLNRVTGHRGAGRLREALARGAVPTRSLLEDVVYDLIVSSGFVPPAVNRPIRIAGRTVIPDFRWSAQQLIVEADGARWHGNALARAGDAERQALLEASGETVLRVGWDEAVGRPTRFATRLAAAGAPLEPRVVDLSA